MKQIQLKQYTLLPHIGVKAHLNFSRLLLHHYLPLYRSVWQRYLTSIRYLSYLTCSIKQLQSMQQRLLPPTGVLTYLLLSSSLYTPLVYGNAQVPFTLKVPMQQYFAMIKCSATCSSLYRDIFTPGCMSNCNYNCTSNANGNSTFNSKFNSDFNSTSNLSFHLNCPTWSTRQSARHFAVAIGDC